MSVKLKIGSWYLTRRGNRIYKMTYGTSNGSSFGDEGLSWHSDGRFSRDREHDMDLVTEIKAPVPAPIMVTETISSWFVIRRHRSTSKHPGFIGLVNGPFATEAKALTALNARADRETLSIRLIEETVEYEVQPDA